MFLRKGGWLLKGRPMRLLHANFKLMLGKAFYSLMLNVNFSYIGHAFVACESIVLSHWTHVELLSLQLEVIEKTNVAGIDKFSLKFIVQIIIATLFIKNNLFVFFITLLLMLDFYSSFIRIEILLYLKHIIER